MDITFIGLGKMGTAMARRLLGSGHSLTVFNRTAAKTGPLAGLGAKVAENAAAAVAASPVTLVMLPDAGAIRAVLFPAEGPRPAFGGKTVIQMGTISPEQSLDLQREVEAAGGSYLEGPVLGGPPDAEKGRLHVLVGATDEQFERWRPLFNALSILPRHIGPVGRAAAFKLALNQILAAEVIAFAYSLALVRRSGIEVERFMEVLRTSTLYAPQFEKKLDKMLGREFLPASFSAGHLNKDVNLAAAEGRRLGLDASSVEGMAALVRKAVEGGSPEADCSVVYEVIDPARP
jgi:3-hydroxyisobutyrate dehydrogenase